MILSLKLLALRWHKACGDRPICLTRSCILQKDYTEKEMIYKNWILEKPNKLF